MTWVCLAFYKVGGRRGGDTHPPSKPQQTLLKAVIFHAKPGYSYTLDHGISRFIQNGYHEYVVMA